MILPASWAVVLEVFRRRGTFRLFTVLATGMVAQRGRRTVVGMLAGAGMASRISFHAACRFFSAAVRDVDQLGLAAAGFVVTRLLDPGAPVVVALDDTLFKRRGRLVLILSLRVSQGCDLRRPVADTVADGTLAA